MAFKDGKISPSEIFQAFPYFVVIADKRGLIVDLNQIAINFLKITDKAYKGKRLMDLFREDKAVSKTIKTALNKALSGQSNNQEIEIKNKVLELSFSEVSGNFILIAGIDVTEQRKLIQKVNESEKRFKTLIEKSRDGIILMDATKKYTFVSPAIKDILGFTPEEFTRFKPTTLHHPEETKWLQKMTTNLKKKEAITYQRRALHKDGTWRWLEVTLTNLLDEPSINAMVYNFHDITEKHNAEEGLLKSEKKFRAIIEKSSDGVSFIDKNRRYIYASPSVTDLLGYSPQEFINRKFSDFLHPAEKEKIEKILTKVKPGKSLTYERRGKHKNGQWRWFEVTVTNLLDDPNIQALVSNFHDITERKELEMQKDKRFKAIIERSSDGVTFMDDKGKYTYASPAVTDLLGYTLEEYQKLKFSDLVHPEERERISKVIETVKPGQYVKYERRAKHKNGKWKWYEVTYTNLLNDPAVRAKVFNFHDIDERKTAELELERVAEQREETLALLNSLLANAPVGFAFFDHDYKYVRVNEYLAKINELNAKEHIGKHIEEINPVAGKTLIPLIKKVFETGKPLLDNEIERSSPATGIKRTWIVGFYPVIENKKVKYVGTVITEITDRKKAEEALKQTELRLNLLAQSDLIGILFSNTNGRISYTNDALLKMLGYSKNDLLKGNLNWTKLTPKKYLPLDYRAIEEAREKGNCTPYEKEYIKKDGTTIPVLIGFVLYGDDKNQAVAFILDLTERKKLERQKDEFIGIASHELKTPLTSVKGYTQILMKIAPTLDKEELSNYLQKTNKYVDKLDNLIDDLLDVSRIEAGKLSFNFSKFNIAELVKESVENIQSTVSTHNIQVDKIIDVDVYGDRERLEQVFSNLLTNAIKYSPGSNKVEVNMERDDIQVIMSIRDYGVGIPKEDVHNLFNRFFRVEKTSKQFSGLGIGLYIAHEIISRHNGEIWVESEEGKGSTFYFSLPIKK